MTTRQVFVVTAMFGTSVVYADDFVDRADANGDGFVSLYELRAAHYADPEFNQRIEQSFERYDRNGDGLISEDERQAERADAARSDSNSRDTGTNTETKTGSPAMVAPAELKQNVEPPNSAAPEVSSRIENVRNSEQSAAVDSANFSRTELWIRDIDADNSGGASKAELIASGDGQQWFTNSSFKAADRNADGDLDPDELDALLRSLERRQR